MARVTCLLALLVGLICIHLSDAVDNQPVLAKAMCAADHMICPDEAAFKWGVFEITGPDSTDPFQRLNLQASSLRVVVPEEMITKLGRYGDLTCSHLNLDNGAAASNIKAKMVKVAADELEMQSKHHAKMELESPAGAAGKSGFLFKQGTNTHELHFAVADFGAEEQLFPGNELPAFRDKDHFIMSLHKGGSKSTASSKSIEDLVDVAKTTHTLHEVTGVTTTTTEERKVASQPGLMTKERHQVEMKQNKKGAILKKTKVKAKVKAKSPQNRHLLQDSGEVEYDVQVLSESQISVDDAIDITVKAAAPPAPVSSRRKRGSKAGGGRKLQQEDMNLSSALRIAADTGISMAANRVEVHGLLAADSDVEVGGNFKLAGGLEIPAGAQLIIKDWILSQNDAGDLVFTHKPSQKQAVLRNPLKPNTCAGTKLAKWCVE